MKKLLTHEKCGICGGEFTVSHFATQSEIADERARYWREEHKCRPDRVVFESDPRPGMSL